MADIYLVLVHMNGCGACRTLLTIDKQKQTISVWDNIINKLMNNGLDKDNIIKVESKDTYGNWDNNKFGNAVKTDLLGQVDGYPSIFLVKGEQIKKVNPNNTQEIVEEFNRLKTTTGGKRKSKTHSKKSAKTRKRVGGNKRKTHRRKSYRKK